MLWIWPPVALSVLTPKIFPGKKKIYPFDSWGHLREGVAAFLAQSSGKVEMTLQSGFLTMLFFTAAQRKSFYFRPGISHLLSTLHYCFLYFLCQAHTVKTVQLWRRPVPRFSEYVSAQRGQEHPAMTARAAGGNCYFSGTDTLRQESKLVDGQPATLSRWAQGRWPRNRVCPSSIGVQDRSSSWAWEPDSSSG